MPFEGSIVLRILACLFGSFSVSLIASVKVLRFACRMVFFSAFLYCVCLCIFSVVGFCIRLVWSSCCFCICLLCFGVHHAFVRGLGCFSCRSTVCCIAVWMLFRCCSVVVWWSVFLCIVMMAVRIWLRMVSFCLSYLFLDSVFCFDCFCLGILSWKIV